MRSKGFLQIPLLLMSASLAAAPAGDNDLVGRPAEGLHGPERVKGGRSAWPDLRGKVVLARWRTGTVFPYCRSSAPRLKAWHEDLAPHGLVILGLYHR